MFSYTIHEAVDNDSIVSNSGYLCLAGAGEDASGCVNAGGDEVSRLTSEDAPDSLLHLLHLFLLHFPLLLRFHHFLPFLSPFLFLALCPQRTAKLLCLSPSPALFLHSYLAHKRQGSEWEWGRSQGERLEQGLEADERTGSWEKRNGGLGDEVRRHWRLVEQVEEEQAEVQQGLLGLGVQPVVQMMGEKGERVEGVMQGVDWTETEGQEGWEVELPVPELDSGGVGGQQELGEEECHRVTPH